MQWRWGTVKEQPAEISITCEDFLAKRVYDAGGMGRSIYAKQTLRWTLRKMYGISGRTWFFGIMLTSRVH